MRLRLPQWPIRRIRSRSRSRRQIEVESVTIVECPRDAWQVAADHPATQKAGYLRLLPIEAGFRRLDAVSFVSSAAVPQTADSEEALACFDPSADVEIIGIVMNVRGAERARDTGRVTTLGFPCSVSPTFSMRNERQTPEQSIDELKRIHALGLPVTVSLDGLRKSLRRSLECGFCESRDRKSGWSRHPEYFVGRHRRVGRTGRGRQPVSIGGRRLPNLGLGAHLREPPGRCSGEGPSAWDAGCRRFDWAIGGMGGCRRAGRTGWATWTRRRRSRQWPNGA